MRRSRRKPLSPEEREQAEEFRSSCYGSSCANCGKTPRIPCRAHHVVEAAELRRRKVPENDLRNALPLCDHCHANHHSTKRVPFRKLRAANIDYAYEVLGPFAADYIRARYPMTEEQR